jgi:hypothetical protein
LADARLFSSQIFDDFTGREWPGVSAVCGCPRD